MATTPKKEFKAIFNVATFINMNPYPAFQEHAEKMVHEYNIHNYEKIEKLNPIASLYRVERGYVITVSDEFTLDIYGIPATIPHSLFKQFNNQKVSLPCQFKGPDYEVRNNIDLLPQSMRNKIMNDEINLSRTIDVPLCEEYTGQILD